MKTFGVPLPGRLTSSRAENGKWCAASDRAWRSNVFWEAALRRAAPCLL